ncbi:MAG: hypothetical protein R2757_12245 [Draconibacterium sp.]
MGINSVLAESGSKGDKPSSASAYTAPMMKLYFRLHLLNQYRSGTCWSFSGLSFLESEMLRLGQPEIPDRSGDLLWRMRQPSCGD